jgi:hypothetical protein
MWPPAVGAPQAMPTTLDQTPSEQALHRVLWLVLLLRAMIVHLALAIIGAMAYFATGADGFYPLVTDMIRALRADEIQNSLDGKPLRGAVYAVAAILVLIGAMAVMRWMYASIVQVRRWSLRVLALLILCMSLRPSHHVRPPLQFALEHFHPGFNALAIVASVLGDLLMPLAVAFALCRLSFATERASLLATLDRRLARGRLAYLNKLLDLPRTPFARPRAAVAYVLALAGALVLVASAMFLLTVGGTGNKLNTLVTVCLNHPEFRRDCLEQSAQWAWSVPIGLVLALMGVKLAAFLRACSRRIGALSVHDVLLRDDAPFLLYPLHRPASRAVLHLFHHRVGARLAHAGQGPDDAADELAVGRHVGHAGLQQVVEAAGHQVRFQDLGAHLHGGLEGVHHVVHRAVEQDLHEDQQPGAQLGRVQPRFVAQDEAVAVQALHPFQHRGGRQVHGFGQLEVADAAVGLQHAQDAAVDLVQARSVAAGGCALRGCPWRRILGARPGLPNPVRPHAA